MDEVKDQVQQDSQSSTESSEPRVIRKEEGQAPEEQSETTKEVAPNQEPKLYRDHLGRDLTGDQVWNEYQKTQSYISKLEKDRLEWENKARKEASEAVSENEILKNVDPNVREAVVQMVAPVIESRLVEYENRRKAEEAKKAQDEDFDRRLNSVLEKHDGKDGLPKADRMKILAEVQKPGNLNFDFEDVYNKLHWKQILDKEIKDAMRGKSSAIETESTGGSQPRKPETKAPRTWGEAGRSALGRIPQE